MSSLNVKRVRTVKYSNMLDRLISVAEYSIFTDESSKFATLIIYNSSDRLVKSFEMKLDIYDENKAKIKTKVIAINNLHLRPRLFLKLKAKISLPLEAQGFNYTTTSVNSNGTSPAIQNIVPTVNKPIIRGNYPSIKTRDDKITIHPMDASATKSENIKNKTHLKTKWLLLIPIVGAVSILFSSIYFLTVLRPVITSTTREKGSGELKVAEKRDFIYENTDVNGSDAIILYKYKNPEERKKLYIDPSVFVSDYTGQIIYLAKDCFRDSSIERLIVQGPCNVGSACFAYASNFEYFACVNYTYKNVNYPGEIYSVDSNGFFGCVQLTTFKYQVSSLRNISAGAFYGCERLSNFVLPDVARIDKQAFYRCISLGKDLYIPSSVEAIGEMSFYESSVKEVTFGNPSTRKEEDSFDEKCKFFGSNIYDENGEEIQNG